MTIEKMRLCKTKDPCQHRSTLNDQCYWKGICGDHNPPDNDLVELERRLQRSINKTIKKFRPDKLINEMEITS